VLLQFLDEPTQFDVEFLAKGVAQHSASPKQQATFPDCGFVVFKLFAPFA
jgi:hypothetical protein